MIEKLKSIENGFTHLLNALEQTGQSGATKILKQFRPELNHSGEESKDNKNMSKRLKLDQKEPGSSKTNVSFYRSKVKRQVTESEDDEVKPDCE